MASYTEHPANRLGYLLVRILLHYPYVLFPVSLSITEQILKSYQDVKACQTSQITPTALPIPHLTAVLLNYQARDVIAT